MTEPNRNTAALLAALALLFAQGPASAQLVTRFEAGAVSSSSAGVVPFNAFSLTPDVRYNGRLVDFAAHGSAWLAGNDWQFADGDASATFTSPTRKHVSVQFLANASRAYYDAVNQNDQVEARARVHLIFSQKGGMWLESGVARPWRVAVVSSVDVAGAGAWTTLGDATITGTLTNFSFTRIAAADDSTGTLQSCTALADPGSCLRQSHFSDVQGSVHWEHAAFEVDAQTGYRFGDATDVTDDSRRWASATAVVWVSPEMALVVGGGRQPANPARGLPARNYAHLGAMFAAWPAMSSGAVPVEAQGSGISRFEIAAAGASLQRVQVRVIGVHRVEVMGDFTDWQPVAMVQRGRDLWEALVPIAPGVHQMDVRVDGGKWLPPPGTPTMRDGFSGEVGVLVIQQ